MADNVRIDTLAQNPLMRSDEIVALTNLSNALRLGQAIDGTRNEIWLCAKPLSPNLDIYGSLNWREAE